MSAEKLFLGIDTSNYTTSVAIINDEGVLLANLKRPLEVKEGERGLRQSDAVFSHVKNLPLLMEKARDYIGGGIISAVGVSERPRNIEGSYMPCFLSGVVAAQSVATAAGSPLYRFSHQCGHIMAALYSSGKTSLRSGEFAAFHISGGTTELLRVRGAECGFSAEIVGGTKDLNAGQIVDRIGVHLGLLFPAGPHMERLAFEYSRKIVRKKLSVSGCFANLSGLENMAVKLYEQTGDPAAVAAFVFDHLGEAVCRMCDAYIGEYGEMPFVFAGGVMSNSIMKSMIKERIPDAYFAEPALSSDNAVGIAALARERYLN